jgi:hypothetical protein
MLGKLDHQMNTRKPQTRLIDCEPPSRPFADFSLPAFLYMPSVRFPDDVVVVLDALPRIEASLLARANLRPEKRTPDFNRKCCCAVILEASRLIQLDVQHRSKETYSAYNAYWKACATARIPRSSSFAGRRLGMIDLAQLPIFPCNLAKEPLSVHGFKSARSGAKWKQWPLVGFRTGAASGIDVLDIDPDGRGWFDQNYDALPQTRSHETQRGLHLLFKHAPGLRCSTNKIAQGVDVRADGGYVIWLPSTGRPIEDAPICEWPEWLLAEARGDGLVEWYPSKERIISTPHDPVLVGDCTAALREMNVEDWRDEHDAWFELWGARTSALRWRIW